LLRKLWVRRKAVSTMIGGIIVLSLFLTALVAMVVVSQQYDTYQGTVDVMSQKDIDRASENLQGVLPAVSPNGVVTSTSTCTTSSPCNSYIIYLANLGIATQIARIYIVTNVAASPLPAGDIPCSPCILDPAPASGTPLVSTPTPSTFDQASTGTINPGEPSHGVVLWLPGSIQLIWNTPTQKAQSQSITVVTTRGRVFSFLYPFPYESQGAGPAGGTGLQIGPLVITFQESLITYTNGPSLTNPPSCSNGVCTNPWIPPTGSSTSPAYSEGYWVVNPSGTGYIIFYVKIQADWWAESDVYLTQQSELQLVQFGSSGAVAAFFVVAPPTLDLCTQYFQASDSTVDCSSSRNTVAYTNGDPTSLPEYYPCKISPQDYYSTAVNGQPKCPSVSGVVPGYRYRIPMPTADQKTAKARGNPVYVAFAADTVGGSGTGGKMPSGWLTGGGTSVTTFLGLQYVYDWDGGGHAYIYGVTLPFISLCVSKSLTSVCST
jgi:hypothetical protein